MRRSPHLFLFLFLLPILALLQSCSGQKITVVPEMVVTQTVGPGAGSATALFDGNTATYWFPGWAAQAKYPAVVMLDLGREVELTKIRVFDGYGMPQLAFAAASELGQAPVEFLRTPLGLFDAWSEHSVSPKLRYLYISLSEAQHDKQLSEIELYAADGGRVGESGAPISAYKPAPLPRRDADKINLCGFHWVPLEKLRPFAAQRIFQMTQWTWRPENKIMVEPSYQAAANYDTYYAAAKSQGINIIPCINQTPDWLLDKWKLGTDPDIAPADPTLSKTDPAAYTDLAAYWFQIAARYGRQKLAPAQLNVETTPRWTNDTPNTPKTGLDLLTHLEVWNEPDKWWKPELYMEPEQYCALLSACYDGHEGRLGPNCGIKTADPTMQVLMAGLVTPSRGYLDRMLIWAKTNRRDQHLPCDIVNVHHYSSKGDGSTWTEGAAPETDGRFYQMKQVADWAHRLGLPLWYTEFGYDTKAPSQQYVTPFAGRSNEDIKADWLVRVYLESLAAGVDNMFVFNAIDEPGAAGGGLYQSSGLLTGDGGAAPFSPKPAYTAVVKLIRELEGYTFERDISPGLPAEASATAGSSAEVPATAGSSAEASAKAGKVRALVFRSGKNRKVAYWSPTGEGKSATVNVGFASVTVTETPQFMPLSKVFWFGL